MNTLSGIIRKLTIPPVFAATLLITIYITFPHYYNSFWGLIGGVFFLTVLPTLAYPLQKYIPHFKSRGREGQRSLAMIFSFVGYLVGTLIAFLSSASIELKVIYLEYLFCGIGMLFLNKVFRIKASGHACGVVGPVLLLVYFDLYIPALIGAALILPVYISSVRTKQHTISQLIIGSIIPLATLCLIISILHLLP